MHRKYFPIIVQQDATSYSLFISVTWIHVVPYTNNFKFYVRGSVHRKYFPITVQQDATLYSLFISVSWIHVSGGTSTHHQEQTQLNLQHLVLVKPLLLPAAIVEEVELAFQLFHDSDR